MTKTLKTLLLLFSFTLVACSGINISDASKQKWEPAYISGTPLLHTPRSEGIRPFLEFKGNILHGIAGDNLFRCEFDYDSDGNVSVGRIASTKVAGLNNKYEKAFLAAIKDTTSMEYNGSELKFYNKEGVVLMHLIPYDPSKNYVAPIIAAEAVVVGEELTQEEIDAQEFAKVEEAAVSQTEEELQAHNEEIQEAQALQEEIDAQEFAKVEEEATLATAPEEVQAEAEAEVQAEAEVEAEAEVQAEAEVEPKAEVEVKKTRPTPVKAQKAASLEDIF